MRGNLGEYAIKMNFIIYLLGAFVCGFCVCMLNTVVNPMLNLLGGGGNKGNQLIQAGGALNSLSGTLTPLFVGALIGSVTPQTAMSDVAPLLFIAMGVFVSAFIALSFIAIPEPHLRKAGPHLFPLGRQDRNLMCLEYRFQYLHTQRYRLHLIQYGGNSKGYERISLFHDLLANGAAIGGAIAAIYWLLMLVGRSASSVISGKVATRTQLIVVSATAICFILIESSLQKKSLSLCRDIV